MPLALIPGLVLVGLILTSCNSREDLEFFDKPGDLQRSEARRMETADVYRLYKMSFERPPPPTYELIPVVGERGYDIIYLWVKDLSSQDTLDEVWEYGPLLREVKKSSNVTICQKADILDEAVIGLAKHQKGNRDDLRMTLKSYC